MDSGNARDSAGPGAGLLSFGANIVTFNAPAITFRRLAGFDSLMRSDLNVSLKLWSCVSARHGRCIALRVPHEDNYVC